MRLFPAACAALLVPLSGCTSDDADAGTLTVLAASSLTEPFTELGKRFEAENPGVEVDFSFGSSTTLAEQVTQGAPGDVLATADRVSMDLAVAGDAVDGDPAAFATNVLVLVVPAGNPARIDGLEDLDGTDWVRCTDDAPCGKVAAALLEADDVDSEPKSLEIDVKSVLAKVTSGEADAGLVYASDALAAADAVETIELPGATEQVTTYFIGALDDAGSDELAAEWVTFVSSDEGRQILTDAGFGAP